MKNSLTIGSSGMYAYFMHHYLDVFEVLSKRELEKHMKQFAETWDEKEARALHILL